MSPYTKKIIRNIEARIGSYTILLLLVVSGFSIMMVVTNMPSVSAVSVGNTNASSGTNYEYITYNQYYFIKGNWIYFPSNGVVDSICVQFATISADTNFQCGLYNYTDYTTDYASTLYAKTAIRPVNTTNANQWVTFYFNSTGTLPNTKPTVTAGTRYYVFVKAQAYTAQTNRIFYTNTLDTYGCRRSNSSTTTTVPFVSPMVYEGVFGGIPYYCMYANYTVTSAPPDITLTSETPTNASIDVSQQPQCDIHIANDLGGAMNVTFATNQSGSWVNKQSNASVANNSDVYWTFTDASGLSTKYWWKVYCQAGTTNFSETYYFTTAGLTGTYSIAGLTADEFTWSLPPGGTGWANNTGDGTGNETLNITTIPGAGYTCTAIYIDFTDFDSEIMQENMSIEVRNSTGAGGTWDKTVYTVPDSDGNVTLNASVWTTTAWTHGNQIFPINASQTKYIQVRVRITYPTTASTGDKVNAGAWRVTWKLES